MTNMTQMIGFYNAELARSGTAFLGLGTKARQERVDGFIDIDQTKISWTHNVKQDLQRGRRYKFELGCIVPSMYRPFTKQWLYYSRLLNERVYQMPRIFPAAEAMNRVVQVSGVGAKNFSALIVESVPNLDNIEKGQAFPEFLYEETGAAIAASSDSTGSQPEFEFRAGKSCDLPLSKRAEGLLSDDGRQGPGSTHDRRFAMLSDVSLRGTGGMTDLGQTKLFSESGDTAKNPKRVRREAITDAGLDHFQSAYPNDAISKQDLFFYIYGLLHSPDYRERYADNLSKELPRIPRVRTAQDFWHFSKAGRDLADLHLNYETVEKYPLNVEAKGPLTDTDYRVEKMKFAKKKDPETGKALNDRSTVIYNNKITLSDIPEAAYEYVVNGKAALDWVMERQAVRVDKASGIVNDANDWAIETMGNPKYPLELFQRLVTVSLETQKIVASLPTLEIREDG